MQNFKFNAVYIIESLKDNEPKTGQKLYEDLNLQGIIHSNLCVKYFSIQSKIEWDNLMNNISIECESGTVIPILHLEIHGFKDGISFTNGDIIYNTQVCNQFRRINYATQCNLFITLGVCNGLYCLFETQISSFMPFCGAVGSFDILNSYDIQLRYAEFYGEFFRTFDIASAMHALYNADPNMDAPYKYIPVDELFFKTYHEYITKKCTREAIKKRADESIIDYQIEVPNRQQRRKFERDFAKLEQKTRYVEYKNAVSSFFGIKAFPNNMKRFDIPKSFNELAERYQISSQIINN